MASPRSFSVREWGPLSLLGLLGATLVATWFRREFNHDDFFFAYTSWLRSVDAVPFRDFYLANFTPPSEYAEFLFRAFPESFIPLHVARAVILAAVVAITTLIFATARLLGASLPWAMFSALLFLAYPDVIMRMSDVRSDPIGIAFLLGASASLLRWERPHSTLYGGLLYGLAIAFAFKVILVTPFLFLALLLGAERGQRVRRVVCFGAAAAVAPSAYYLWRLWADGLDVFIRVWKDVLFGVAETQHNLSRTLLPQLRSSPITPLAVVAGVCGIALAIRAGRARRRALAYAAGSLGFVSLSVVMNPLLFPYNFVLFVAVLAPLASGIEHLLKGFSEKLEPLILISLCVLSLSFGAAALVTVLKRSSAHQVTFVKWLWRSTSKSERVFDWQGIHFGRRGIYHWWNFTGIHPRYLRGDYSLEDELRANRVSLIIDNFRLRHMTSRDANFIRTHFIPVAPCVLAPGTFLTEDDLQTPYKFEVFVPGTYLVHSSAPITIDGRAAGRTVRLTEGVHTFGRMSSAPTRATVVYTTPLRKTAPPCGERPLLSAFG